VTKSLKSEKRIISGVQNLDIMRFIVGIFAPFLLKLGICPASVFGVAEKIMSCGKYL